MNDDSPFLTRARSWDAFYAKPGLAAFRRRLYLEVFGQEYPAELGTDGYITRSELQQMVQELGVGPGQKIADLGCGRGGPGQWVALTCGVSMVGIDFSEVALQQAREGARQLGLGNRVSYLAARFDSTGLADASVDGAMSVDVIWALPDKLAGFAESARILHTGAKFVFTDWERDASPPGYPPPLADHRPLLKTAGFELHLHRIEPQFDVLRRAFYHQMLERQDELMAELGRRSADAHLREARAWLGMLDGVDYMQHSRRVLVVARKV